jgi:hypothetical protein
MAIAVRQKVETVGVIHTGGGNYAVTAVTVGGAKMHLMHVFRDEASAHRVAAKVACRGTLDAALWTVVGVQPQSRAAAYLDAKAAAEAARRAEAAESRLAA